jgi:hypothetical protein
MHRLLIVTVPAVLVALPGCGRPAPGPATASGTGSGSIGWIIPREGGPAGGFDHRAIAYTGLPHGRVCVLWTDCNGSTSSETADWRGVKFERFFTVPPGGPAIGQVTARAALTPDGQKGTVTIQGQTYDFAAGNLFLISAAGPELRVKQLRRDFANVKFTREGLEAFARADDEVRAFFETKPAEPAKP